jgi:hypothetical protein
MIDDSALRERVRQALEAGALPGRDPDRMWGGVSVGARCSVCQAAIAAGDLEMELDFERDDPRSGVDTHRMHIRCLPVWQSEWRARSVQPEVAPGTPAAAALVRRSAVWRHPTDGKPISSK